MNWSAPGGRGVWQAHSRIILAKVPPPGVCIVRFEHQLYNGVSPCTHYLKNQGTNTGLVCTYLNNVFCAESKYYNENLNFEYFWQKYGKKCSSSTHNPRGALPEEWGMCMCGPEDHLITPSSPFARPPFQYLSVLLSPQNRKFLETLNTKASKLAQSSVPKPQNGPNFSSQGYILIRN